MKVKMNESKTVEFSPVQFNGVKEAELTDDSGKSFIKRSVMLSQFTKASYKSTAAFDAGDFSQDAFGDAGAERTFDPSQRNVFFDLPDQKMTDEAAEEWARNTLKGMPEAHIQQILDAAPIITPRQQARMLRISAAEAEDLYNKIEAAQKMYQKDGKTPVTPTVYRLLVFKAKYTPDIDRREQKRAEQAEMTAPASVSADQKSVSAAQKAGTIAVNPFA